MAHALDEHREAIDAALAAGASKAGIARALGVTRNTLAYYLDYRDLPQDRDIARVQDALRRLAESAKS